MLVIPLIEQQPGEDESQEQLVKYAFVLSESVRRPESFRANLKGQEIMQLVKFGIASILAFSLSPSSREDVVIKTKDLCSPPSPVHTIKMGLKYQHGIRQVQSGPRLYIDDRLVTRQGGETHSSCGLPYRSIPSRRRPTQVHNKTRL